VRNGQKNIESAEILTIGTEMLLGDLVDTNSAWISQHLAELGVGIYRHTTVGDNRKRIVAAMSEAEPTADELRASLEAEAAMLRDRVHELDAKEDDLSYDEGFADSAQVAAERGENKVLYDQLRRELDDIEHALARMDEGTYGTCEVCGGEISAARLELLPATRFCIDHA